MSPEPVVFDAELVSLGFTEPTEAKLAREILARFAAHPPIAGYFKNDMSFVEGEEIATAVGQNAKSLYLSLPGQDDVRGVGNQAYITNRWLVGFTMPQPVNSADTRGAARFAIVDELKIALLMEHNGVGRGTMKDDEDNFLCDGIEGFATVAGIEATPAGYRTSFQFTTLTPITESTREAQQ